MLLAHARIADTGLKPEGQALGGWGCVRTANTYLPARINAATQRAECFSFNATDCQWQGAYACTSDGKMPSTLVEEATVKPVVAKPRDQVAPGSWEYYVYAAGEHARDWPTYWLA